MKLRPKLGRELRIGWNFGLQQIKPYTSVFSQDTFPQSVSMRSHSVIEFQKSQPTLGSRPQNWRSMEILYVR